MQILKDLNGTPPVTADIIRLSEKVGQATAEPAAQESAGWSLSLPRATSALFVAQGSDGIDARGFPRGHVAGGDGDAQQQRGDSGER